MVVQSVPGAAFEVVEAEFLLELLVRLFARPAGFDGSDEPTFRGVFGKVAKIVLTFLVATFTDEPGEFLPKHP